MGVFFAYVTLWKTLEYQFWGYTVMYTGVYFNRSPCTYQEHNALNSWMNMAVYMDTQLCSSLKWTWAREYTVMYMTMLLFRVFLWNFILLILESYTSKYTGVYLAHIFFWMSFLAPFHSQFHSLAQVMFMLPYMEQTKCLIMLTNTFEDNSKCKRLYWNIYNLALINIGAKP